MVIVYQIVLLGPPTAGKSTLSYLIAQKLIIPQINVGQLLRKLTDSDNLIKQKINNGQYLDDQVINKIVFAELKRISHQDFILDGFPRTIEQLGFFKQLPYYIKSNFIYLDLDIHKVRERFFSRVNCPQCRRAFYNTDGLKLTTCQLCGFKLNQRSDLTSSALEAKLNNFFNSEQPVIMQLELEGNLKKVSVKGEIDYDFPVVLDYIQKKIK